MGGADRGDVFLAQVKPDEKIAGEQGLDLLSPLAAIAVGLFDVGQIDLECLAAQIFRSTHFLSGFGMDGVPVFHVGYLPGRGVVDQVVKGTVPQGPSPLLYLNDTDQPSMVSA